VLDGARARGVAIIRGGEAQVLEAGRVVLAAGAYGSPAILLRSGVGDSQQLARLDVETQIDLPAVGQSLTNHWTTRVLVEPGSRLSAAIALEASTTGVHAAGTIAKAASRVCAEGVWDVHLFTICWRLPDGEYLLRLNAAALKPESRGVVTLASRDPEAPPRITHNALSDPSGQDARVLTDGLRLALRVLDTPAFRATDSRVTAPLDTSEAALVAHVTETLGCYYHPVGTCAIGSVVDGNGAVRGAADLYVADASIIPTIPRANTHLSVLAVAERLAESLCRE
jgi:choline dehydrogenase-like flavoprotein